MNYQKTYRANNVMELTEEQIRAKETLSQLLKIDDAGNIWEEISYNPDGSVGHIYNYTFDEAGRITAEILKEDEDFITEHRTFEYNEKGQLHFEKIHYADDTYDAFEYLYNEAGQMIEKNLTDSEGESGNRITFEYQNGRPIAETELNANGKVLMRKTASYNQKGQPIEETLLSTDENYRIVNDYDPETGFLSLKRKYNASNQLIERNTYTSDEVGNAVGIITETPAGVENTTTVFNQAGLITVQDTESGEGGPLSHIERAYDEQNRILSTLYFGRGNAYTAPQNYRIRHEYL